MMNGYRESDSLIVSEKPLNKARDNKRAAERVERRRLAKGNSSKRNRGRTQCWLTWPNELERVRQMAQWNVCASIPEAGAQCISSARRNLCGECRAIGIPTVPLPLVEHNKSQPIEIQPYIAFDH